MIFLNLPVGGLLATYERSVTNAELCLPSFYKTHLNSCWRKMNVRDIALTASCTQPKPKHSKQINVMQLRWLLTSKKIGKRDYGFPILNLLRVFH